MDIFFFLFYFILFFFFLGGGGGGHRKAGWGAFLCILCGIFLRSMYRMVIFWGDVKISNTCIVWVCLIFIILLFFIFWGEGGW